MSNLCCQHFYQVVPDDENYPNQWFLSDPLTVDGEELDGWDFRSGERYGGLLPYKVPVAKEGTRLAFSFGSLGMPVVTGEIARILAELAGDDIVCLRVLIDGVEGGYAILNTIFALDCLDEEHSEFTRWTLQDHRADLAGKYRVISTIRIDPRRTAGHQLFRIKDFELPLLVSEKVKEAIKHIPDLGVVFRPVT